MMIPLRVSEILAGTGAEVRGELLPNRYIPRIERDSRQVQSGDLFIAIRGERFDGHQFVEEAASAGAVAALVAADWADQHPEAPIPLLVVDEPVAALQRLAAARRALRGDDLLVIGVTGSVGKTSTKEVIAAVLGQKWKTYRSAGNLNNEIGLPISLLEIGLDDRIAVLEMGGAYAFGELALLASIARPKVAVVTNIYPVHIERMGTIEAIAQTKSELVAAIPSDGLVVLNGDDHRVRAMADLTQARVITYGLEDHNDIVADSVHSEGLNGTRFRVWIDGEDYSIKVPLIGSHAIQLAMAAIGVAHGLGMHISEMLPGFNDPGVQVRLLVLPGPNGSRLIDDTYNASTPSVLSALSLLEELHPERAVAVLGDMRELGNLAEEEHRIVGRRAGEVADLVVTFGDLARLIADEAVTMASDDEPAFTPEVRTFGVDQREELVHYLLSELREGDVVLLKGSRGLEMETIVQALRADGADEGALA